MTKLMAFYLPQFHETDYNNEWWGQGYTDWMSASNAKPLFKGHDQPRKPLNNNYYDLSEESAETLKWQAKIARENGIYGFAIYHYWFPDRQLLDIPVKILRKHPEIDINYNFCWDAGSWRRTWTESENEIEMLVEQNFGDREVWTRHYNDLSVYFSDPRYIKIDNKPVFQIYKSKDIDCLEDMKACWNELAIKDGYNGVYLIVGDADDRADHKKYFAVDAFYNYEPQYTFSRHYKSLYNFGHLMTGAVKKRINALFHTRFFPDKRSARHIYSVIGKDRLTTDGKPEYLGIQINYDDTPRRGLRGIVYTGNRLEYFRNCLKKQILKSQKSGNEFLYITAWNEWGETAYLEPDEKNGYAYLKCIRDVTNGQTY